MASVTKLAAKLAKWISSICQLRNAKYSWHRMPTNFPRALTGYLVLLMSSCSGGSIRNDSSSPGGGNPPVLLTADCVPGATGCAPLTIQGDGPFLLPNGQPAPFSGFADPCLRRDPQTGTLWLTYSWPNNKTSGAYSVPCVDTHLASSTDGGNTFSFQVPLWPAIPVSNPSNPGQAGFQVHGDGPTKGCSPEPIRQPRWAARS